MVAVLCDVSLKTMPFMHWYLEFQWEKFNLTTFKSGISKKNIFLKCRLLSRFITKHPFQSKKKESKVKANPVQSNSNPDPGPDHPAVDRQGVSEKIEIKISKTLILIFDDKCRKLQTTFLFFSSGLESTRSQQKVKSIGVLETKLANVNGKFRGGSRLETGEAILSLFLSPSYSSLTHSRTHYFSPSFLLFNSPNTTGS